MIKSFVIFAFLLYLLIGALLFVFQRQLIYIGADEYQHNVETITLANDDEKLKVHVLNPGRNRAILYFGGNAEPVIFNADTYKNLFPAHTVYLVNYRGYGGSTGTPKEAALYSDALSVFDHVKASHSHVSVIGRSLGSGVATYVAAHRKAKSLVLITPYDSIRNVAQVRFPIYPMSVLLLDQFDSIGRASEIRLDTLVLIAERDQIIPVQHSYRLVDALQNATVTTALIPNADHNNLTVKPEFQRALMAFFD